LYPNLLNGTNETLKNLANSYIDEMGGIADIFTDYKNQFNTKSKIITAGIESFLTETRKILKSIEIRINKEENELYKMINKL
jgi:hypothetical protein